MELGRQYSLIPSEATSTGHDRRMAAPDAVIVGAGPNGLSAAIVLAQAGRSVVVREAAPVVGGGLRSEALTLPAFVHDVCASVMPLAAASPFLRALPLATHGLSWIEPPVPLAHPFDDGTAVLLERSLEETGRQLGRDGDRYVSLMRPFAESLDALLLDILAPVHAPKHPLLFARFGWRAMRSARHLVRSHFRGDRARTLVGAIAAHAVVRIDRMPSAAFALVLAATAHTVGWPVVAGGSQRLADALAAHLRALGGEIILEAPVRSLEELFSARTVMLDVTPPQLMTLAANRLPRAYARALTRYRFGPGVFKVDWALGGAVPWAAPECRRAGVVHLGGTLDEIAESERAVWRGQHAEKPFVILAQPSLFDDRRATAGAHTLWAYCHVPNGSTVDMTSRIEAQIERFAPGFRDLILARHAMSPATLEAHDPNLVGGEIGGGANSLRQLFVRPVARRDPYRTPLPGVYICSASTPPGGAVHGMCGYHAARSALRVL